MDATVLLSSTASATRTNPDGDRKRTVGLLIISAAAIAALAAPVAATAKITPKQNPAKHTMSQSALAAMIAAAAGRPYHAAANYRYEQTLVGSARKVKAQKAVRPDDRSGHRGI